MSSTSWYQAKDHPIVVPEQIQPQPSGLFRIWSSCQTAARRQPGDLISIKTTKETKAAGIPAGSVGKITHINRDYLEVIGHGLLCEIIPTDTNGQPIGRTSSKQSADPPPADLISTHEAARATGIGKATIDRAVYDGTIRWWQNPDPKNRTKRLISRLDLLQLYPKTNTNDPIPEDAIPLHQATDTGASGQRLHLAIATNAIRYWTTTTEAAERIVALSELKWLFGLDEQQNEEQGKEPDDLVPMPEAARIIGISSDYLRKGMERKELRGWVRWNAKRRNHYVSLAEAKRFGRYYQAMQEKR